MRFLSAGLLVLFGWSVFPFSPPAGARQVADDKKDAGDTALLPKDGPGLVEFFRKRIPSPADRKKIRALIERLGDDEFQVREQALEDLAELGLIAVPLLQNALQDSDTEVVERAKAVLARIEKHNSPALLSRAAELLAKKKPAGGARVLLDYYPNARDDTVAEAVQAALAALAVREGKAEPVLLKALEDKDAAKRAAAAVALVKGGPAALRKGLRKLLQDKELAVRLPVALAFVGVKEKDAVPVLIGLVGKVPKEKEYLIDDLLYRLAGDQVPKEVEEKDATAEEVRTAWAGWWRKHGAKLDLAKIDSSHALLGYTLVVLQGNRINTGSVLELDRAGKVRWEITGLRNPRDAQVVGRDRVLIVEYSSRRVTERNFKGEILWEKAVSLPLACQRLPNGNTFIVSRRGLLEVDRKGHQVFSHIFRQGSIGSARKLRDGQMVVLTTAGTCVRLDKKGKMVKSFQTNYLYSLGSNFDVLANGHILVPDYRGQRVVEYDADGKEVWQAPVKLPSAAQRLPNGNTLVASMSTQEVIELNRKGKEVWKHKLNGRPLLVRRR
jgi:hypothetical protein